MRHSKAEKAKAHKHIVAIASKRFREEGLAGIGIADLMKEAGLTVGGFYKHFKSRDDLVAEAVGSALELWKCQVNAAPLGRAARHLRVASERLSERSTSGQSRDGLCGQRFGRRYCTQRQANSSCRHQANSRQH
jgi:AcrR family transcriptional regulator